jgi:hypothetical protein
MDSIVSVPHIPAVLAGLGPRVYAVVGLKMSLSRYANVFRPSEAALACIWLNEEFEPKSAGLSGSAMNEWLGDG